MTHAEFLVEFERLASCYPASNYPSGKVSVIFEAVKAFDASWFRRVADEFIANERHAPLPSLFNAAVSLERERLHALRKSRESREAVAFMTGYFDQQTTGGVFTRFTARQNGQMSDEEHDSFIRNLKELSPVECEACEDSGYVYRTDAQKYEWTYRCYCPLGAEKSPRLAVYPHVQKNERLEVRATGLTIRPRIATPQEQTG